MPYCAYTVLHKLGVYEYESQFVVEVWDIMILWLWVRDLIAITISCIQAFVNISKAESLNGWQNFNRKCRYYLAYM